MPSVKVDLYNTPGVYYALAYWISAIIFIHVIPGRKKGAAVRGMQALILIVLCVFMTLTHRLPRAFFVPCVLIDFFVICGMIYISSELRIKEVLYYGMRSFMLGELAAALDWQMFYYALVSLGMPLNMRTNLLFLLPAYGLVFGLTFYLESLVVRDGIRPDPEARSILILLLIMLFFYVFSNISYVFHNTAFTTADPQDLFIIRTLSDLGAVGISFAYHVMMCQMTARIEQEKLNQILEMQYASYKISRESMALVDRKYHDLRHQISYLKSGITEGERREVLDQMEEEIRVYEALNKSGNEVLDAILSSKTLECMEKRIQLTVMADGGALHFMKKADISALFGNILDNAIEGVRRGVPGEERLIRLNVSRQKGFVTILAENRFTGEVSFEDGIPVTTKKYECGYHGFGVRSIRATAEKYGGNVMMKTENGWFSVHVLIPDGGRNIS